MANSEAREGHSIASPQHQRLVSRHGQAVDHPLLRPYWYFKFAGESPGLDARTTRGDPLKVNVRSSDRGPLLLEAHQYLSDPIDLSCCREMQIVFRNDVALGALPVSLSLKDSERKLSQNLGIKYVAPSLADQPPGNTSPVEETLVFPFPKTGSSRDSMR
jgi:hypothetical protein